MKKIFFSIIWIIITLSYNPPIFANTCESSCTIVDAPSPLLVEYLENLRAISENLIEKILAAEKEISTNTKDKDLIWVEKDIWYIKKWFTASKNRVMTAMNSILSFQEHYASFDFFISLEITNEVPAPVKRDYKLLTRESEKLIQILEKSAKRWSSNVIIENICTWIKNCSIPNLSAGETIASLINNNNLIIQLFQSSVLEKPALAPNGQSYTLVASGFQKEILATYNKDTLTNCSLCEGWTLKNFREKIKNITFKTTWYKEWVAKWKAAWAVLRGWNPTLYEATEKTLLWEYLQGQWINTQQADIVLWNLERYEETGLSSNDPLTNSTYYSQTNIKQEADTFKQSLIEAFDGNEKVPIISLTQVDSEIKNTQTIEKNIHSLFEDQKPFAFTQDVVTQELQIRILRMHFSLVRSINLLDTYKDIATQACEKPGWWGKCSKY